MALTPSPVASLTSTNVSATTVDGSTASENVAVISPPGAALVARSLGEVAMTSGPVVSTVQSHRAGVGSGRPAVPIARTSKLWCPSARPVTVSGEEQARHGARSTWHSKPLAWPEAEKAKLASWLGTVLAGPESMAVSGSVVSTGGLNQSSAPMVAKAAMESSELSILQSSPAPSGVGGGPCVES